MTCPKEELKNRIENIDKTKTKRVLVCAVALKQFYSYILKYPPNLVLFEGLLRAIYICGVFLKKYKVYYTKGVTLPRHTAVKANIPFFKFSDQLPFVCLFVL